MAGADQWWDDLTRERVAAILELVLDAIADDYANLDTILKTINHWYSDDAELKGWKALDEIPVSRPETIKALQELTEEDFAKAFIYDAETKQYQAVSFVRNQAGVLWFYVTEKGLRTASQLHKRARNN